jgi:hypothetical protein
VVRVGPEGSHGDGAFSTGRGGTNHPVPLVHLPAETSSHLDIAQLQAWSSMLRWRAHSPATHSPHCATHAKTRLAIRGFPPSVLLLKN